MCEFKITVEVPGLSEAINHLADALTAGHTICNQNGVNNHQIDNAGVVNIDPSTVKEAAPAAPENPTAPASAPANATAATAATTATTVPATQTGSSTITSHSEVKSYTLDDISKAGAALIDQGKMPQLIELLKKYGVQAITQLDASVYPAFVEELKSLGAQL